MPYKIEMLTETTSSSESLRGLSTSERLIQSSAELDNSLFSKAFHFFTRVLQEDTTENSAEESLSSTRRAILGIFGGLLGGMMVISIMVFFIVRSIENQERLPEEDDVQRKDPKRISL